MVLLSFVCFVCSVLKSLVSIESIGTKSTEIWLDQSLGMAHLLKFQKGFF